MELKWLPGHRLVIWTSYVDSCSRLQGKTFWVKTFQKCHHSTADQNHVVHGKVPVASSIEFQKFRAKHKWKWTNKDWDGYLSRMRYLENTIVGRAWLPHWPQSASNIGAHLRRLCWNRILHWNFFKRNCWVTYGKRGALLISKLQFSCNFGSLLRSHNIDYYMAQMVGVLWLVDYQSVTFRYGPENFITRGKTSVHNLRYGPRARLIRYTYKRRLRSKCLLSKLVSQRISTVGIAGCFQRERNPQQRLGCRYWRHKSDNGNLHADSTPQFARLENFARVSFLCGIGVGCIFVGWQCVMCACITCLNTRYMYSDLTSTIVQHLRRVWFPDSTSWLSNHAVYSESRDFQPPKAQYFNHLQGTNVMATIVSSAIAVTASSKTACVMGTLTASTNLTKKIADVYLMNSAAPVESVCSPVCFVTAGKTARTDRTKPIAVWWLRPVCMRWGCPGNPGHSLPRDKFIARLHGKKVAPGDGVKTSPFVWGIAKNLCCFRILRHVDLSRKTYPLLCVYFELAFLPESTCLRGEKLDRHPGLPISSTEWPCHPVHCDPWGKLWFAM